MLALDAEVAAEVAEVDADEADVDAAEAELAADAATVAMLIYVVDVVSAVVMSPISRTSPAPVRSTTDE